MGKKKKKDKASQAPQGKPRLKLGRRTGDILGLGLVWLITAAMLGGAGPTVVRDAQMLGAVAPAAGEVLDWKPFAPQTWSVRYRFTVDGTSYEGRDVFGLPWRPSAKAPVEIEYLVRDPSRSRPAGDFGWVELLFFSGGVLFCGCALFLSVKLLRGEKL